MQHDDDDGCRAHMELDLDGGVLSCLVLGSYGCTGSDSEASQIMGINLWARGLVDLWAHSLTGSRLI